MELIIADQLGNSISEKYPHIVREFFSKEMPIEENDQISMINCDPDQIEGWFIQFFYSCHIMFTEWEWILII